MSCQFQILVNMEKIVRKLFMNEELFEKDLLIRPLEKKLLSLILKHKFDQRNFRSCDFTVKNLNTIRQKKMRKKSEDGLKFIFRQFLHEIRTKFALERGLSSNAINTANFDYLFYGHHFGEISKKFQIFMKLMVSILFCDLNHFHGIQGFQYILSFFNNFHDMRYEK